MSKNIILGSPLNGVLFPLERVPDPAFAQKMVGDGISIDPTNDVLCSPCSGTITSINKNSHALTIATNGIEILLHIGIDTVNLKGEGFSPIVKEGDEVSMGDKLITFDPKFVASKAPYLLTQMLITTMDAVESMEVITNGKIEIGDEVLKITVKDSGNENVDNSSYELLISDPITVLNPVGLHARPASQLSQVAKKYSSDITLKCNNKEGNAKSITSIMKLETAYGDKIIIVAKGQDSQEAIQAISSAIEGGLGEETIPMGNENAHHSESETPATEVTPTKKLEAGDEVFGTSASAGVAVGKAFVIKEEELDIPEKGESINVEEGRISTAIVKVIEDIKKGLQSLGENEKVKREILSAHLELLQDPDLFNKAIAYVNKGYSAAYSWNEGSKEHADEMASLSSALMAERANDVRDVSKRVLYKILGKELPPVDFPQDSILIAEELTPSVTANLDPEKVKGFATVLGGATSHVAILARSLGIPAVVGVPKSIFTISTGDDLIIDGTKGTILYKPSKEFLGKVETVIANIAKRKENELASASKEAIMKDDHRVEVVANVGKPSAAAKIKPNGGEGVGLLRSEFIFLDRTTAPTEDEQFEAYKTVLESVNNEDKVVIRTLDVGGDKPLAYLPLPQEENPFLGERGIRVGLNRPDILRTQIRALLRASQYGNLHIMFPMVGDINEWHETVKIVEEEKKNTGCSNVKIGIMIEIPSAAIMADVFAKYVDFFSVGTNDLTQYTMAIDRGHPKLGDKSDGLHPAVLRLIKMTVDAAHKEGKWVGVCGGLAGDPQAVPVLTGLGVDELSVSIPDIPSVKAQIRELTFSECQELANKALEVPSFKEVRELSPNPYGDETI